MNPTAPPPPPVMAYQSLPPTSNVRNHDESRAIPAPINTYNLPNNHVANESPYSSGLGRNSSMSSYHEQALSDEKREFLTGPDETLFMQVFVEEVGLWMDSMDPMKHVSRLFGVVQPG